MTNPNDPSKKPQKPSTTPRKAKHINPEESPDPTDFEGKPMPKLKTSPKGKQDMMDMAKRKQTAHEGLSVGQLDLEPKVDGTYSTGTYTVLARHSDGRFVSVRNCGEVRVHLHPKGEGWPLRHLPITYTARRTDEGKGHDSFRLKKANFTEFLEDLSAIPGMSVLPESVAREALKMDPQPKRST